MFFLPAVFLGTRLRDEDLRPLSFGLAILNLIALAFGVAEYFKGIEPFFPYGPMTMTMYNSLDSAGGQSHSFDFQNAHTYAGVMVFTVPILFGAWALSSGARWRKCLLLVGNGGRFRWRTDGRHAPRHSHGWTVGRDRQPEWKAGPSQARGLGTWRLSRSFGAPCTMNAGKDIRNWIARPSKTGSLEALTAASWRSWWSIRWAMDSAEEAPAFRTFWLLK